VRGKLPVLLFLNNFIKTVSTKKFETSVNVLVEEKAGDMHECMHDIRSTSFLRVQLM